MSILRDAIWRQQKETPIGRVISNSTICGQRLVDIAEYILGREMIEMMAREYVPDRHDRIVALVGNAFHDERDQFQALAIQQMMLERKREPEFSDDIIAAGKACFERLAFPFLHDALPSFVGLHHELVEQCVAPADRVLGDLPDCADTLIRPAREANGACRRTFSREAPGMHSVRLVDHDQSVGAVAVMRIKPLGIEIGHPRQFFRRLAEQSRRSAAFK